MDRASTTDIGCVIEDLNRFQHQTIGDPETLTRISQYELAFRMQVSVPEVMDIGRESQETLELYGAKPGYVSDAEFAADPRQLYKGDDATFAGQRLGLQGAWWRMVYVLCSCMIGDGITMDHPVVSRLTRPFRSSAQT